MQDNCVTYTEQTFLLVRFFHVVQ